MKLLYLVRACCTLAGGRAGCSTAGDAAQVRQLWYGYVAVSRQDSLASPGQCPVELQPCSSSHTAPLAWHCAPGTPPNPQQDQLARAGRATQPPALAPLAVPCRHCSPVPHRLAKLCPHTPDPSVLPWMQLFLTIGSLFSCCDPRTKSSKGREWYQHLWPCPSGNSPSSNVPAAGVKTQFAYPSTNGTIWSLISTLSFHGFALLIS